MLASNHFSNHIQNLSHKLASNQIQQFCIQFIKPFLKPFLKPNHKTLYPIYKNISQTKYNNIPQTHPYTVILLISRFTHNNSPEGGVPPLRGGVTDIPPINSPNKFNTIFSNQAIEYPPTILYPIS